MFCFLAAKWTNGGMAMLTTDCHCMTAAFLLSLTVVLRVTSQRADVTTTRYHGDESYDVTVTSAAHEQYVNPRPGKRYNIILSQ